LYFLDRKKITFKLRITKKEKLTKKKPTDIMAATTTANKSPQQHEQQQHRRQQHLQWSACILIVVFGLFSMLAGNCVNGVSGVVFFPIPIPEIRKAKKPRQP